MTTTEIKHAPAPLLTNPGVGYALVVYARCQVSDIWSDRLIAETFALKRRDLGARLILVRVVQAHVP